MNAGKLNSWLQLLGSFGVIAGLVFVGLQLRLDREVALSGLQQTTATDAKYWAELITDNADVWNKGLTGERLTDSESLQFEVLASAWQANQFNLWRSQTLIGSPGVASAFVREAALELHPHPGLLEFFRARTERSQIAGFPLRWQELVKDELNRLATEATEG